MTEYCVFVGYTLALTTTDGNYAANWAATYNALAERDGAPERAAVVAFDERGIEILG